MHKSFIDAIRNGKKIKQPSQPGFCITKWSRGYQKYGVDDADQALYRAGLWHFKKLEACRKKLSEYAAISNSGYQVCEAVVGHINRHSEVAQAKIKSAIEARGLIDESIALNPHFSGHLSIEESIEAAVGSARYIFYQAITAIKQQAASPVLPDEKHFLQLSAVTFLASYYSAIEELWKHCLWLGRIVNEEDPDLDMVVPSELWLEFAWTVGLRRRSQGRQRTRMDLTRELRKTLGPSSNFARRAKRVKLLRRGRFSLRSLRFQDFIARDDRWSWMLRVCMAYQDFPGDILDVPLPQLCNLTSENLILCWEVLTWLVEPLRGQLPQDRSLATLEDLANFCPSIREGDLFEALAEATQFDEEQIRVVMEMFTNNGNVKIDPWFTPLVRVGPNHLAPILSVVETTDLTRLIEWWLKIGGLDLQVRGEIFERHVRTELLEMIQESPLDLRQYVSQAGIKLTFESKYEEIDLLWLFGNTLFVIEAKCISNSVEPLERYNALKTLRKGAEQAARKTEFIRANLELLRAIPDWPSDASIRRINPMVVSNLEIYSGFPLFEEGVAFVDLREIGAFMVSGGYYQNATVQDGRVTDATIVRFYETSAEAEITAFRHFLRPRDSLERMKKCKPVVKRTMVRLDETERPWGRIEVEATFTIVD